MYTRSRVLFSDFCQTPELTVWEIGTFMSQGTTLVVRGGWGVGVRGVRQRDNGYERVKEVGYIKEEGV